MLMNDLSMSDWLNLEHGLRKKFVIIAGADAVLIAKKAKPKSDLRILAEGSQLPDKGACLHYKKSFRWFRYVKTIYYSWL